MNLKRLTGLLMAVACFNPMLHARKSFWDGADAYLGQSRPSDTPRVFAPGLLADPGTIVMDRIGFSPDGKEIYYLQDDRWYSLKNAKLKVFKYDGRKWNGPTVLNEHFFRLPFPWTVEHSISRLRVLNKYGCQSEPRTAGLPLRCFSTSLSACITSGQRKVGPTMSAVQL